MSMIYEPRGKAGEYAELAANLYTGCGHGCVYCYVPQILRIDRQVFSDVQFIKPKAQALALLRKDARRMAGDQREILLSFTTDPYQPCERETGLTRAGLEILAEHGLKPTVLTKGDELVRRDFDLLASIPGARVAVTLTTDNPDKSSIWEPGAAPPEVRIENLRLAHEAGIGTWVSFEPVFDTEAVFRLMERTAPFVDLFKIGMLNYHPAARRINWPEFRRGCENLLGRLSKAYLIKKDLMNAR